VVYVSLRESARMEVRIDSLLSGGERATGSVVIIDAFRAFTTAAVVLARGAAKIVMVAASKRHGAGSALSSRSRTVPRISFILASNRRHRVVSASPRLDPGM
jgi:hypothetical protein